MKLPAQTIQIKILIIDDDENFINSFVRVFSKCNFAISICLNPIEALDIIAVEEFDFIISDERMPNMYGTQFLEKSKELQPNAKRILLTGHPNLASSMDAVNKGSVCGLLVKPFTASSLLKIIFDEHPSNTTH